MDNDPDKRWRRDAIVPPPGTMAATWFEEGRTEGKAELILQQMERRFGEVPGAVRARITGASTEELDAWGAALLDAPTIEDVVTSGSRH